MLAYSKYFLVYLRFGFTIAKEVKISKNDLSLYSIERMSSKNIFV